MDNFCGLGFRDELRLTEFIFLKSTKKHPHYFATVLRELLHPLFEYFGEMWRYIF